MNDVLTAVLSVTAIGLVCAVMLAVASRLMAVPSDGRIDALRESLPGANCGACGFAGCDGYAAALAEGGTATNLCTPGGDRVSRRVSDILGVGYADVAEQVAVVLCRGDVAAAPDRLRYAGIETCAALRQMTGGKSACPHGCAGYGDCAAACPEGAIRVYNGLARVDPALCTGCGLCARACPFGIIAMMPDTAGTVVLCSSTQKGALVRRACAAGCIACGLCVRVCPRDAIAITDNLARIDPERCDDCGLCAEKCPVSCIVQGDFRGVHSRNP